MSEEIAFTWFHNSPDVNDPACLCSVCLRPITCDEDAEDEPDSVPLRLWTQEGKLEARFHHACVPAGVLERIAASSGGKG